MRKPLGLLVPHLFNHQTHHRGQVHAMLTAAGERTGDTDLMLLVDDHAKERHDDFSASTALLSGSALVVDGDWTAG